MFQNPFDALNPRFSIRQSLAEPLLNAGIPRPTRETACARCWRGCICPTLRRRSTNTRTSCRGGQLQRVVLARALILNPAFIVADEPVSMLDVSVRAGILNLLREVRDTLGLAALYISHDVTLVRYVCVRTLVMYRGRIVEDGPTEDVIRSPRHPYTRALISAVPVPRVDQDRTPIRLRPARRQTLDTTGGCLFRDRCPQALRPLRGGNTRTCAPARPRTRSPATRSNRHGCRRNV